MLEAECTRCKETFIPGDITLEDLIHGQRVDGGDCGGIGVITGQWLLGQPKALRLIVGDQLTMFEKHGWDNPMCNDPDCEFHHPEVREN